MEKEKKLLISDYDLTYDIDDYFSIVHNTKRIKKFIANGNIFAFATMRNFNNFKRTILFYNLKNKQIIMLNVNILLLC